MQITIEIDEKTMAQIDMAAKGFKTNRLQYINETLQKAVRRDLKHKPDLNDEEKVKRFAESYQKNPQKPEEYEIWLDEQVWED